MNLFETANLLFAPTPNYEPKMSEEEGARVGVPLQMQGELTDEAAAALLSETDTEITN